MSEQPIHLNSRRSPPAQPVLVAEELGVFAGARCVLRGVDLAVFPRQVLGLIGPSGAGKSTLLKCLNRLIDLDTTFKVTGGVLFHGRCTRELDVDQLRARVGMVFQQPVIFPKSIYQNVIFGIRRLPGFARSHWPEIAERALRRAALWNEVKDRLLEPAAALSVGQQQRLCLARTLASEPEVILMDEPTSALDPRSTAAIEELVLELKAQHAIVMVTHNIAQARRVADSVACLCVKDDAGQILEIGTTCQVLEQPEHEIVAEYLRPELAVARQPIRA